MKRFAVSLITMLLLVCSCPLAGRAAPVPTTEPMLRVETGMHMEMINRIDVDKGGRWLVSASNDKTVRVWDLASIGKESGGSPGPQLQPARILRPPIAPGKEGKLYSVAITPDGALVAAGGWTEAGSTTGHTVYLFSRTDGRLVGRAGGLGNVILQLAFSPDGRFLAATLGDGGVRIFTVSPAGDGGRASSVGLRLTARDVAYDRPAYGAHFSPDGNRLVTACYDGMVRVYDTTSWGKGEGGAVAATPMIIRKVPGGERPFSVRFSPDGAQIAVCFDDTAAVSVLASSDLGLVNAADTGGANGAFASVAWSADGRTLYGGGRLLVDGSVCIRSWPGGGKGAYRDRESGVSNVITALAPLPDGGLAYGAADPTIGVLGADGVRRLLILPELADFRGTSRDLLLSEDGGTIQFGYKEYGTERGTFSLADRSLSLDSARSGLTPPDTSSLPITRWKNTPEPALSGSPLPLDQFELSRSLAIAPDRESFLLGTSWALRRFDKRGGEQWSVPVPGDAWAVNIDRKGNLAVVACGDGTIRWYRYRDGKELLAFFPHADRKRWILWTASGYYDASLGGEELIGWHLNRGKDAAADFYPASRFRETRYRPDIIARIVGTGDEDEAVRLADAARGGARKEAAISRFLPPVVAITAPDDNVIAVESTLAIHYTVRAPTDAPATSIRVMVDGRPVTVFPAAAGEAEQTVTIAIPSRDCVVSIIAENRHAPSVPGSVRVNWRGKESEPVPRAVIALKGEPAAKRQPQSRLFLLAVGVSDYRDKGLNLRFAAKDAEDFAAAQKTQAGRLYREVQVKMLPNGTKREIISGLAWLKKEVTANDVGMIFLAGHGVNDAAGFYYFLPADTDLDELDYTGLVFSDIRNTLSILKGKAVIFLDTCHSGSLAGGIRTGWDMTRVGNELGSAERGVVVFASSSGSQFSYEDEAWNNGAFTKALLEGLSGKADVNNEGVVTVANLNLYVNRRVKRLTNNRQEPDVMKPGFIADFTLATIR
ncbi:caspase family protein [Geomonas paludis]|uniref:Peptidase C14 caspase domain-containing protein n=1 Tax=Geomonas paludis TaxID=2740185 RepID=A0A6V8MVE6_9BACT|nr:caspase family protein [Geomonas paludis]GFO64052.1 hypothetical protein GMPD_19710 [Geomonas paludis]